MIINVLEKEFDFARFLENKIILDHFPLHDFNIKENLDKVLTDKHFNTLASNLPGRDSRNSFYILNSVFNYYGSK